MKRIKTRKLFWAASWGFVFLALSSFGWAAPSGKITVGMDTDTPTLDPHRHSEKAGTIIHSQIFDSLFSRQVDMKISNNLVEDYKVLSPTLIQLNLRKGVQFHNDEPFNAQVVKFSLERVLDRKTRSPRTPYLSWLKNVEVVDNDTVKLHFKNPHPIWIQDLLNICMVPPRHVAEKGDSYFGENPVGTGPYRFVKWTRSQEVVLTANPKYFLGEPRIQTVVFKIIPDASTRLAALISGTIDLMRGISPEEIPVLRANSSLRVYTLPITRFQWFCLSDALNTESPLSKKGVRQALNYGVNVQEIVNNIIGGLGTPTTALNPLYFGWDPAIKPYPYDPQKAKSLLKEAGYPNGFPMTIHYTPANMIKGDEVAQAVQSYLTQIGIEVKLQKWSAVGYMDIIRSGRAKPCFGLNWGTTAFDGDAILFPFFRSGQTYAFFHTPELDQLIDAERREMDPRKRKDILIQAQQIIREEAPWIFMYSFSTIEAGSAKLDYRPRSDELFYIYEMGFKK